MSGMTVGQPWEAEARTALRIEAWTGSDPQWAALTTVRNATRTAINPAEYPPEDEATVRRYYGHPTFALAQDARLVWVGAEPVGAAICYPLRSFPDRVPTNFEIFVVPAYGQHGIGARLLAHLTEAARGRGHHALTTTINQHYTAGRDFLRQHGFRPVSQHAHLTRSTLDALPPPALPPGFQIRDLPALGGDPELYRTTLNRLGAYDSGFTLLQPEDLAYLTDSPGWHPAGIFFLSTPEDRLVGILRAGPSGPDTGYLHEVHLDPGYRGQGLATALVATALQYLARQGCRAAALDTDTVDTPPYRLARRCGFTETLRWVDFLKPLDEC